VNQPNPDPVADADAKLDAALRNPVFRKRLKQATSKTRILTESDVRKVAEGKK